MSFPHCVGSVYAGPISDVADRALAKMGTKTLYAVSLDPSGRVWVDHVGAEPKGELLCVTNRKGEADWLAEEIRFSTKQLAMRP